MSATVSPFNSGLQGGIPTSSDNRRVALVLLFGVESLGLKELRQHASDYVKRAEAGETMLITVAGRPSALLGPAGRKTWCAFDEVADIFRTDTDPTWETDRRLIDDPIADPWVSR